MTNAATPRARRPVRTPTVLQMEVAECGAAALGIVLAYHGRRVPLEELRVACGVSRDGSRASSMVKAARRYGLTARGMRRDPAEMLAGPLPAIAFWNFNHFVVVEGTSGGLVHLNDPAVGRRRVSREEFDASFTGVSLEFEPGPQFERGGRAQGPWPMLWRRLAGLRPAMGFVAWVSLMLVVPGLMLPGLTRVFVDNVLIHRFEGWLSPLLVGLGLTFLVNLVLEMVQELALLRIELRLAFDQSARFVWHLLRLPMEFFGQRFAGDLVSRVDANDHIAHLMGREIGRALAGGLTAIFLGIVMLFYDPLLAVIAFVGVGLNVAILQLANRGLGEISLRLQVDLGRLFSTSVVGLQSVETLKATGGENDFFGRWTGYHARAIASEQQLAAYTRNIGFASGLLSSLTMAAILGVGASRVIEGAISVGTLVAFQSLLSAFLSPVQKLVGVAAKGREVTADIARLDDVLHYRHDWRFSEETPTAAETADAPTASALSLRGVSFGYNPTEPPLIEDFSLDVAPGRWVALVGASGSGKTTLGRLIAGLYRPRAGEVALDGRPLVEWGRAGLSQRLAAVDQDIHLFAGTVRDNVTLWDPAVSHARLAAALDDAGLSDAVQRLPGSYDGRLVEGGSNFNAGQRQRLEIARALAREPSLLVLDEATASLDAVSEKQILDAVRRRGMTCVLVAHRLSTIRDCDEIVVLERGKAVERGDHATLMTLGGAYAKLVSLEGVA